jgi:hypothetical protein
VIRLVALSVGYLLMVAAAPRIAQINPTGEVGWLGLYNIDMIDWLNNEHRLADLCPGDKADPSALAACQRHMLEPKSITVALYAAPNRSAPSKGSVTIRATPGQGLEAFYAAPDGSRPNAFTPDVELQDWGYGPYFHETYLDRRDDWFLLPEKPFLRGSWINARDFGEDPNLLSLETGEIYNSPAGSIVLIAVERDAIRARPEQPADMWCDEKPPPLKPWKELRIPKRRLYSPTGHLLLSHAYMKGC